MLLVGSITEPQFLATVTLNTPVEIIKVQRSTEKQIPEL